MRQSDLEREMHDLGVERYWKKVNRTTQGEMESNHPLGKRLLTESVALLAEEVESWKRTVMAHPTGNRHAAYPYIDMLPPALVAAITARTVIDSISMHKKLTKTANNVARMLEDEVRWRAFKDQEPDIWKHNEKQLKRIPGYKTKRRYLNNSERFIDLQFDRWPIVEKTKVGMVLVELMRRATGIIDITTRVGLLGKRETFVHPTDELMGWLKEAHKSAEDLSPIFLPMITSPVPWTGVFVGGYHTDAVAPRPMVKTQDRAHLDDLDNMGMGEPIWALNSLQDVPWRINQPVFDALAHCWEQGVGVGDLPPSEDELIPSKPVDIDTNDEARRRWRKAAARIRFENNAHKSKRLQVAKVMWMGKKFYDQRLYFPWHMDFRSRMYPRPYFLQPQGPDWSRAMLMAADGAAIETDEAENSLAIQGANAFGEDKCSLDDRVQWTHANTDFIKEIAADPRGTLSAWGRADKPWAFLAFCLDWAKYMDQGRGYVSHLPCSIDGASNGLQLLSLLMLDPVGAKATNVLPTECPNDIYQDIANAAAERLQLAAAGGDELARTWLSFGISRGCTKRPTMVVPYSGTKFSCKNYIVDWFRDELKKRQVENPFGWEEIYRPCTHLTDVVWDSIGDVVGEARKAMTWMQDCADVCMQAKVPMRWMTPTGFLVKQAYENWASQSVRTIIGDVIRQHKVRVGTGKLSRRKARNGISPNFIHSIDSSIAQRAVLGVTSQGVRFVNAIHDDLAVLAPHVPLLRSTLCNTVADIFSDNLMERFAQDLSRFLPTGTVLPEPPTRGTLDVNEVRNSLYLFA
tara:strand:+ start:1445 stop:3850 length:2406 start_codon:yes stop_codon:yes gene_type:complete